MPSFSWGSGTGQMATQQPPQPTAPPPQPQPVQGQSPWNGVAQPGQRYIPQGGAGVQLLATPQQTSSPPSIQQLLQRYPGFNPSWGAGNGQMQNTVEGAMPPNALGAPPGTIAPSWGNGNGQGAIQPQPGGMAPSWGPPTAANPNPGHGLIAQQPIGTAGAPPPAGSPPSPEYLSQLLPPGSTTSNPALLYGVPQINAPQTATPQSIVAQTMRQYFGGNGMPQVGGVDPSQVIGGMTNAMLPQFKQQQQALTESLANAGIMGGSTTGAVGALGNQQQSQLLSQIAPFIMQGMQMNQNAQQFNVGNELAGAQFDIGNNLSTQGQNVANRMQNNQFNAGLNMTGQNENQNAAMQGGMFNATNQNAAQQFDIANLIKNAMYDSGNYNSLLSQELGFQNQDWLAQLEAMTGLNSGAAGGQTGAFQPVFQQPTPTNFGALGTALAPNSNIGTAPPTSGSTMGPRP